MNLSDVAHEVVPGLWVSGMPSPAWDLAGWGVQYVVSLSEHTPPQGAARFEWGTRGGAVGAGRVMFTHFPFEDAAMPDPELLSVTVASVSAAVRSGMRVLVHCQEGRNRSGLVAALAVRDLLGCSGAAAVDVVRSARPGMLGNRAFAAAVTELEAPAVRRG